MKNSIVINSALCTGCGKCVKDCVSSRLSIVDGKAKFREGTCLECGHCFAICPSSAVEMPGYDVSGCGETADMAEFDSDRLLLAMKSRRTIRQFKNEPVSDEEIAKILEAGRYSPTGTNMQDLHYTVITKSLGELEAHAVGIFRKLKNGASPLSKYIGSMNIDDNFFFKGAPLVIIVSGKSKTHAGLASSYMELMAESMGLGVLYSGFFLAAARLSRKIKKQLGLPKGLTPYTCMIIGRPNVSYKRIVPRKELKAKYM